MTKSLNYQETILAYHERTKHHLERYAKGPDHIDWEAPPEPMRRYAGTSRFELPLMADKLSATYTDLFSPATIPPHKLTVSHVAALLELSLGLSAWKEYAGHRWALRCNPSSGNLHPTEGYVVLPSPLEAIPAGVYHYVSYDHLLEQRGKFNSTAITALQKVLHDNSFLLGLTSIPWREAWKYGERAFRYCQHDLGHAITAIRYAAAILGWSVTVFKNWSDLEIMETLGLQRRPDFHANEPEIAEVMLYVETIPPHLYRRQLLMSAAVSGNLLVQAIQKHTRWYGKANLLDPQHHYDWPIIETILETTIKPVTNELDWTPPVLPPVLSMNYSGRAADLLRQRRSAQQFDGKTALSLNAFYHLLDSTLPRPHTLPWDLWAREPRVHLILFVHRVVDLAPGLYIFLRRDEVEAELRIALSRPEFEWRKPESCPSHLKLYQLLAADAQTAAMQLSCHQHIAADSAFSLGMLAEFEEGLKLGSWCYKQLFWETGIIGQVLYLAAETVGVRGTGIGCYFDDAVHSLLGLQGIQYQSLYHFTIGTPGHDERIQTLPPYAHLHRECHS